MCDRERRAPPPPRPTESEPRQSVWDKLSQGPLYGEVSYGQVQDPLLYGVLLL